MATNSQTELEKAIERVEQTQATAPIDHYLNTLYNNANILLSAAKQKQELEDVARRLAGFVVAYPCTCYQGLICLRCKALTEAKRLKLLL